MNKIFIFLAITFIGLTNINGATFSSVATGNWNASASWTITAGVDTDGNNWPDADDDVTINAGHTITLMGTSYFKTLLIQATGVLSASAQNLGAKGNFTNLGTISGTLKLYVQGNCILSSSTPVTNTGDWFVQTGILTIAAGTTVSKTNFINVSNGKGVNNLGVVACCLNLGTGATWTNGLNSTLTLRKNISGSGGIMNASGINNTVTYLGGVVTQIWPGTYYNLHITQTSTKAALGNIIALNTFSLSAPSSNILNLNNFNLTVGGNWSNSAGSTITNQGTVTFNGTGTQIISRAGSANEIINTMVINGTGTTVLNKALTVTDLTVSNGVLDLSASSFSVNLLSDLVNNATINCSQGSFNLNGSAAQTISGSSNTQFYDLSLNNAAGVTINSAQSLSNMLTVTNGNFNSNSNFTLLSDAVTTARIAQVGAGGSFTNNMTIQQFISGRVKGWHDLSSPALTTTIMDWDDEMYMSGIGPYDGIVGPAGVDGPAAGFMSFRRYNEPTAAFVNMTGSATALTSGSGYEVWFADDQTSWAAKVVDTKGVPTFGTKVIPLSFSAGAGAYAGVNLVGNPFASFIDYSLVSKINAPGSILILDNTGNYSDYGTNAIIPAHQGFWVTATSAGGSISIPETAKTTDVATQFYRKKPNYGIKLVFSNPSLPYYNENTINFETKSSLGFDLQSDALFIKSPNEDAPALYMNFGNDSKLITNAINSDENEVAIPLAFYTPVEGVYYIEPSVLSIDNYNYVWIENTKTGEKFDLDRSIAISGNKDETNIDYVLHLSKEAKTSTISQTVFENDLLVFNIENNINIKANNTDHNLTNVYVYDLSGKLVLEQSDISIEKGNTIQIDISNLSKGMYIVQILDELNHTTSKKIIK